MSNKVIKGVLVKVRGSLEVAECENSVEALQKIIRTECFDIQARSINGINFDVYCDDEWFCKGNAPILTAYCPQMDYNLCGNLFFTKTDGEGETISLTDKEIEIVKNAFVNGAVVVEPPVYEEYDEEEDVW